MKGLVADANAQGQVEFLLRRMQADEWAGFWQALGLVLRRFEDVGLSASSTDLEIWSVCQTEQLILITDNRNLDSEDSLEATIRRHNAPQSLPIFTIANMDEFRTNSSYVKRVVEALYDYRLRDRRDSGYRPPLPSVICDRGLVSGSCLCGMLDKSQTFPQDYQPVA